MLVDYLRYVASEGFLAYFFREEYQRYVYDPRSLGLHLRYSPRVVYGEWRRRFPWLLQNLEGTPEQRLRDLYALCEEIGLGVHWDDLLPPGEKPGRPGQFRYEASDEIRKSIEIVVDTTVWQGDQELEYEGVPIRFRFVPPAEAHARSGSKIFCTLATHVRDQHYGTLCGFLRTDFDQQLALTAGHVAEESSRVYVEEPRSVLGLRLRSRRSPLGVARWDVMSRAPAWTSVDASLVALDAVDRGWQEMLNEHVCMVAPISSLVQEELVSFVGAGSRGERTAKVAAVTVKKTMLVGGQYRAYEDMLMLTKPGYSYFSQGVSRPGDSGAAVISFPTRRGEPQQWRGMLVGGDPVTSYASHAEHVAHWVKSVVPMSSVELYVHSHSRTSGA